MKRKKLPILNYLRAAKKISPQARFLLEHGQPWRAQPLPENIPRGEVKDCYRNAALLTLDHPGLKYVEGLATPQLLPFPVEHAWCVDQKGRVIDPTWDKPEESEYFGIVFRTEFLRKFLQEVGYYGLLCCWEKRWPIQRGEYPVQEWKINCLNK